MALAEAGLALGAEEISQGTALVCEEIMKLFLKSKSFL